MLPLEGIRQYGLLFLVLLVYVTASQTDAKCPEQCSCPASPPVCPPGVSWATDACGCCRVCARQFNEDCSPNQPCDHIKGLQCQMGAGGDPERGLCRAEAQGRPCEFDGRLYQHGEDFQPSCQHRCSCMDGVIGCMPLCPHQIPLPDWHCASPRLTRPLGRCCEEWVCDDSNRIEEEAEAPPPHPNAISKELPLPGLSLAGSGATFQEWTSQLESQISLPSACFPQTTDWSECSATCGMGVSGRVTNSNAECRLVRESRLCQVRPCDQIEALGLKKGKKCQRTIRPKEPLRITFAGCSTARLYRPRSCGSCSDGRCCTPSLTRTARLRFLCPDGESFTRRFMWILRCRCRPGCRAERRPSGPSVNLHNDIHTFAN
ncbi:cellular communication network factor 1, like 2 [Scleropages formosus]|uniref:Cellular communication network factor 1, like 2 n=1 Tax=Scleropages formosus TaxID=113540 RepID=A0A8C9V640_SCLFO|nr:protein CYR61-like [Scleropages formosus]